MKERFKSYLEQAFRKIRPTKAAMEYRLETLTKLEEALFRECISLRECTVPPGVTEFGEAVFRGCVSLRWVDMPSVLRMTEGAFYGCAALRRLRVSQLLEGAEERSFCTCPLLDAVVSGIRFRGGKAEKP